MSHRYYQNVFPAIDDIVIVKIKDEDEYGYYGDLLEYCMEGFLSYSEITKKKKLFQKHPLKLGDILPLCVVRIEQNKEIIDLSKRRVKEDEIITSMEKYKHCTNINKIINELYNMYRIHYDNTLLIEDLMSHTIWKLYDDSLPYDKLYNNILENPKILLTDIFDEDFITKAHINFTNRITKHNMMMETDIYLNVMEEDAINKIKTILITNIEVPDPYILHTLILAPPHYKLKLEGPCSVFGMELMNTIIKTIQDNMNGIDGQIKITGTKLVNDVRWEIKYLNNNLII